MSDTIDINVYETTEDITINVTPNIIEVNINKITSTGAVSSVNGQTGDVVLTTSDLTNDSNFVSDASYVHTDNNYTTTEKSKLAGIEAGAEVNVNADWNATSGDAQILNKPTIPSVAGLVPYTGANQDVDLGTNNFNAKAVKINGTAGSGHVGLKHQSANATAQGQETALFAGSDGELYYKNDGNTLAQIASRAWVNLQGFITSLPTATTIVSGIMKLYTSIGSNTDGTMTQSSITTALNSKQDSLGYTPENTANKSTSTADSASTTKFPVWSVIISYFSATQIRSILGISTLSGSNTGDQDLSGLALKQMGAYSFRVNNTNATANATETNFQQIGKTAYTGTITWTGTTAPSGTTNHTYNWIRIGNLVTLTINLVYGTAGALNTAVQMALPSDVPTPLKPDGLSAASNVLYEAIGKIGASESNVSTGAIESVLRSNSANTGFELYIASVSANGKVVRITCNYFTA